MIAQMMIANLDDRVIKIVVLVVVLVEYKHMEIWMIVAYICIIFLNNLFPEMTYFSKQSFPQDDLCILTPNLKLRPGPAQAFQGYPSQGSLSSSSRSSARRLALALFFKRGSCSRK